MGKGHSNEPGEKALKKLAERTLGKKRFKHVENVADMSEELALRYGVNVEKARKAAWLHDIAKEFSRQEMLEILSLDENVKKQLEKRPFIVWHGPVGALYAREKLGVSDEEILLAVSSHTTGRPGMGSLEKLILLADMISRERDYKGVDKIRQAAREDLDKGVYLSLEKTAAHVIERGIEMDNETQQALDWLKQNSAGDGGFEKSGEPPAKTGG